MVRRAELPDFPPCVYFLVRLGVVVYVGSSVNLAARIPGHRRAGKVFDEIFYVPTERRDMLRIEQALIQALRPKLNRHRRKKPSIGHRAVLEQIGFARRAA